MSHAASCAIGVATISKVSAMKFCLIVSPFLIPAIHCNETSHHLCKNMPRNRGRAVSKFYVKPRASPSETSSTNKDRRSTKIDVMFFAFFYS